MNFKTGLVSVSFRELSPEEIVDLVCAVGLKYIEWGSDVHAPQNDGERLSRIAAMQKERGVECCSYGTYFRVGVNAPVEIEEYIAAAKLLGTRVCRIWCGNKSSLEYSEEERMELLQDCRTLAEIAEKQGAVLCLECHRGTFTDEADWALWLMENVGSPCFKMYWQPEVIHSFEENTEYAKLLSDRVVNIHVFNWDKNGQYPLKDAVGVWKKYLENFSGEQHLLLEFMPDGRSESLKTENAALIEIMGE